MTNCKYCKKGIGVRQMKIKMIEWKGRMFKKGDLFWISLACAILFIAGHLSGYIKFF